MITELPGVAHKLDCLRTDTARIGLTVFDRDIAAESVTGQTHFNQKRDVVVAEMVHAMRPLNEGRGVNPGDSANPACPTLCDSDSTLSSAGWPFKALKPPDFGSNLHLHPGVSGEGRDFLGART